MRGVLVLLAAAAVTVCSVADGATNPYTLSGPKSVTSAWPTPAAGYTWGGGPGSVTESYQTSAYSGGKPNTTTYTWKLPASIPADGAKGSITVDATAGSEVWAPGFSINGVLVGCSGITNTPSYGTGCADGDHAAVAVSLRPGQSKSVTQDFLIKPGVGQVTVVIAGYSPQFVYASTSNAATTTTTTTTGSPRHSQVTYSFNGSWSHYETAGGIDSLELSGTGTWNRSSPAQVLHGSAKLRVHRSSGWSTFELTPTAATYTDLSASYGGDADQKVAITYKVTSSPGCPPVGYHITVFAEEFHSKQTGSHSVLRFSSICGRYRMGFSDQTVTVQVATK
jgi:hypothetical protein